MQVFRIRTMIFGTFDINDNHSTIFILKCSVLFVVALTYFKILLKYETKFYLSSEIAIIPFASNGIIKYLFLAFRIIYS